MGTRQRLSVCAALVAVRLAISGCGGRPEPRDAEDGGSMLNLVMNNVRREGWADAVGWAECP